VLTESQLEEKKAAEAELSFAKTELEKETDTEKLALLTEEVATKERNLEQLLASFEVNFDFLKPIYAANFRKI
jgi:hypothetical protein